MKYITLIILSLSMMGCVAPRVKTVYQDKYIPIPYIPAPPHVEEPEYYSNTLTEAQKEDIGELTKAYVIDSKQAVSYAENLKKVYDSYTKLAETSENRIKAIESLGGVIDRSLMGQAEAEVKSELYSISMEIEENTEQSNESVQELRQMKKPD